MIRPGSMPLLATALLASPALGQTDSGAPDVAPVPGLITRATPRLEAFWLGVDDYPRSAIRAEQEGRVGLLLDIGADGRVSDCTLLASSGSRRLDEDSCALLKRRGRFLPARERSGKPAPDRWNYVIDWKLPPPSMFVRREIRESCIDCHPWTVFEEWIGPRPLGDPEQWLQPADYPPGLLKRGGSVEVTLTIARNGTPRSCRVTASSGLRDWDRKICPILRLRARFEPESEAREKWRSHHWWHRYSWAPAIAQ